MKKAALLIGVIGIFTVYSFVLRHQRGAVTGTGAVPALSPTGGGSTNTSTTTSTTGYKDGTYTGASEDAFYGNVQVSATISGGKITEVRFLSYPNDSPNSQDINSQATPVLKQEALKAQSAKVDIVSGATQTSQAFALSLQSALRLAKA